MRLFEVLILTVLFFSLIRRLYLKGKSEKYLPYPLLLAGVLALHLWREGGRWQMVPVYILLGVQFLRLIVSRFRSEEKKTYWGTAFSVILLLLYLPSAAVPFIFPVFFLPQPTGKYRVGLRELCFKDKSREEHFTEDPNDNRVIPALIWYPVDLLPGVSPIPYWPKASLYSSIMSEGLGSPKYLYNHFNLVKTHSYPEAPLSMGASMYPVLVFSHGYMSEITVNTIQMEELASHGYIVVSIAHPYEAAFTVYPDGSVISFCDKTAEKLVQEQVENGYFFEQLKDEKNRRNKEFLKGLEKRWPEAEKTINLWKEDMTFVLDELENLNRESVHFGGRLDLNRLGLMGLLEGGTSAVTLDDERFKAAVSLDGFLYSFKEKSFNKPLMFFYSEEKQDINDFAYDKLKSHGYSVTVKGSVPTDYCDIILVNPLLRKWNNGHAVSTGRMIDITNSYLLSFFNTYLKGEASELLGKSSSSSEVDFKILHK